MVREVPSVPRTKEPRREEREESVAWASLPLDKLLAHMRVYRDQLYSQLRNTVLDTAKQVSCPIDIHLYTKVFPTLNLDQESALRLLVHARLTSLSLLLLPILQSTTRD